MAKSKSSQRWLSRQRSDPFVARANQQGYRSRAAYKLLAIQQRDRLMRPGNCVVDLGAAPGGWSQIASQEVGKRGRVIALDILPMEPLSDVYFIQDDFTEQSALASLDQALQGTSIDLVISDMAPNLSGVKAIDQPKIMYLCELALDFSIARLAPNGDMLIKVFHGEGFDALLSRSRRYFARVSTRKPEASRKESRETYLLARGLRGHA